MNSELLLLASARVLAAAHSNALHGLSCSDCDAQTQSDLNCLKEDLSEPVLDDSVMGLEFCSCPLNYISSEALAYYDKLVFYETFHVGPEYNSVPYRFWIFVKEYKRYINKYQELALKGAGQQADPTSKNLSALKSQFLGKKA
jgi:hypothetical protein